jgi:membrane protease YdiL (CAAX protease family)
VRTLPLPRTTYLWLFLLAASMLLGNRLTTRPASDTPAEKRASAALSAQNFERSLEAERLTRTHYALTGLGGSSTLPEARTLYRELALTTNQLNPARKALILGNQLKLPLDESVLKRLPVSEQELWRALYAPSHAPALPDDAEAQLKAMQLRFLDNQALADLYWRQSKTQAAQAAEARRDEQARSTVLGRLIPLLLLGALGGVVGLGLLIFVSFVALRRQWYLLGRIPEPQEPKLTWGELVDSFVFYLASYRAIGVLVLVLAEPLRLQALLIPLQLAVQFGAGLLAIAYLAAKARRVDTSLAELGWSRERLIANVFYGIGGYLATLPLLAVLGYLSKLLFRDSATTTPNPAMTLLSGRNTALDLGLLFMTISVGAPLFEEFFFRGVLFSGLRRRFSGLPSLLLSAVVFALVHPTQDWLVIVGLGFSFAVMRHLRQSLVPGMVAHFLQNTATFFFLRALFEG